MAAETEFFLINRKGKAKCRREGCSEDDFCRPTPLHTKKDEILDSFNEYDANRDGYISLNEAHIVLETKLGLQLDQTKKLMRMCNKTGNEQLSRDEFADFFLMVTEQMEELRSIFDTFDLDQDGSITFDEAKIALRELGFLDLEIEQLVKTHDTNNDGRLQFEEFVKMWNG